MSMSFQTSVYNWNVLLMVMDNQNWISLLTICLSHTFTNLVPNKFMTKIDLVFRNILNLESFYGNINGHDSIKRLTEAY